MKKLVLVLGVILITMSSFTMKKNNVEDFTNCFDHCNAQVAGMMSILNGGSNEDEFNLFAQCYDGCTDEDGEFVFPDGTRI